MTFRSRSLLNLAHKLHTCPLCGKYTPDGLEPAHSDSQKHGKGMGAVLARGGRTVMAEREIPSRPAPLERIVRGL